MGYNLFILRCPWQSGGYWKRDLVLAVENKNKHFASVSDGAMDKLATKYVPENPVKMTRWSVTAFQD